MEFGVLKLFRSYFSVLMIIATLPDPSKEAKVIDARNKTLSRGTDRGMAFARFKPHKFSYLNITSIGSDFVLKDSECGLVCVNIPSCFSFNLGSFNDVIGKVICELLPSDIYNNSEKFVFSQGRHHYSIASPCISWPCQNKGTCAAQYEENGYLCVCADGFTGKHCELDVDECSSSNECDVNADCYNSYGSYSCSCKSGFFGHGKSCQRIIKANCGELYNSGERRNGVYTIDPDGSGEFHVYCDHTTSHGGWTVFQKRLDGSVDFYRTWYHYKYGFGNTSSEFWLGLEKIHRLTSSGAYELRIDLEDFAGNTVYTGYSTFKIESEGSNYTLRIGNYSGNAGDSFLSYHDGNQFTTKDRDNDLHRNGVNCGEVCKGGWWYKKCWQSNLNGYYYRENYQAQNGWYNGVGWAAWKGHDYSLKKTEMKIRPVSF